MIDDMRLFIILVLVFFICVFAIPEAMLVLIASLGVLFQGIIVIVAGEGVWFVVIVTIFCELLAVRSYKTITRGRKR